MDIDIYKHIDILRSKLLYTRSDLRVKCVYHVLSQKIEDRLFERTEPAISNLDLQISTNFT